MVARSRRGGGSRVKRTRDDHLGASLTESVQAHRRITCALRSFAYYWRWLPLRRASARGRARFHETAQ